MSIATERSRIDIDDEKRWASRLRQHRRALERYVASVSGIASIEPKQS